MTVSELYNSVAQLGFEDSLENEARFLFAANRALLQVNALRPATRAYVINHKPLKNEVYDETFEPVEKTEDLYFYAENVKSYYFEADGNGVAYIEIYENGAWRTTPIGEERFSGTNGFTACRGLIKDGDTFVSAPVRLHFTGDYLYSVRCVAMYSHLYGALPEDVPAYEPYTRYDISALVSDFLSLATPPIKEGDEIERLTQGYDVENGRIILLPREAKGLFKVIYNKKPMKIAPESSAASDDTEIDLDEELCALLPILVASYIWVDDEPEKAQYYLSLYGERAADIERRIYHSAPVPIKNINGW